MSQFIIEIGTEYATNCTFKINEKEYSIESKAWLLLSHLRNNNSFNIEEDNEVQLLLKVIYDNFDEDLINKPVETTNEQLKCECGHLINGGCIGNSCYPSNCSKNF